MLMPSLTMRRTVRHSHTHEALMVKGKVKKQNFLLKSTFKVVSRKSLAYRTLIFMAISFFLMFDFGDLKNNFKPPKAAKNKRAINYNMSDTSASFALSETDTHTWFEVVSWSPRTYAIHNLLSDEEADYLMAAAEPKLKRSYVQGNKNKRFKDLIKKKIKYIRPFVTEGLRWMLGLDSRKVSSGRTSSGTFLKRQADDTVLQLVTERMAILAGIPPDYDEHIYIIKYGKGEKYEPHYG